MQIIFMNQIENNVYNLRQSEKTSIFWIILVIIYLIFMIIDYLLFFVSSVTSIKAGFAAVRQGDRRKEKIK